MPEHKHDFELGDLWSRRDSLSEAEWARLFNLVWEILHPYRPSELASLSDERDEYVQDFFLKKVFRNNAAADGQRAHVGALKLFYRRFLRDKIDAEKTRDDLFVSSTGVSEDGVAPGYEEVPEDPGAYGDPDASRLLAEAGLSVEKVATAADTWLDCQEAWVPVYLGLHFCPEAEVSEPLYKLARRLHIASHHYKAVRLGINWMLGRAGAQGQAFSETLLGCWIVEDLDIALSIDNRELMLTAFKILCYQALIRSEQLEFVQ